MPLSDVVADVAVRLDDVILVNHQALEDLGVDERTPITVSYRDVPAAEALEWLLDDLGLTFTLHEEALVITTPEAAEAQLDVRLHSARGPLRVSRRPPLANARSDGRHVWRNDGIGWHGRWRHGRRFWRDGVRLRHGRRPVRNGWHGRRQVAASAWEAWAVLAADLVA